MDPATLISTLLFGAAGMAILAIIIASVALVLALKK